MKYRNWGRGRRRRGKGEVEGREKERMKKEREKKREMEGVGREGRKEGRKENTIDEWMSWTQNSGTSQHNNITMSKRNYPLRPIGIYYKCERLVQHLKTKQCNLSISTSWRRKIKGWYELIEKKHLTKFKIMIELSASWKQRGNFLSLVKNISNN